MRKLKQFLLLLGLTFIFACSGGGSSDPDWEGYVFSYNHDTLHIVIDQANEITYKVVGNDITATYQLTKLGEYMKIWEYNQGDVLIRVVRFSYDHKNEDDDHMIAVYIKDDNFPEGIYAVGMLEKKKKRPVPQVINWADSVYSGISLISGNEKSDYRTFYIRNFATQWLTKTAEIVDEIFEPAFGGRLEHIKDNPYTYEYRFDGFFENTHFQLAEILADSNTYIAKIYGDETIGTVSDIEIGIREKTIEYTQFPEGQKVWVLCSDGIWGEGVIDDFNPEPLEDIDRPKIDFVFSNGATLTRYATFSQNLCETFVEGSYACDFMYSYILDPIGQIIVLNDVELGNEEDNVDCIGGW